MEGFSNWIKVERMVSNYFSSCNSGLGWGWTHAHAHERTHT